jgi:hypothetical protein
LNNILTERYLSLDAARKADLRRALDASPLALKLLDYLDSGKKHKASTLELVRHLYGEPTADATAQALQNRFFKLRKKVLDLLDVASSDDASVQGVLPMERALYHCRELVNDNFFEQAQKDLQKLVADLWAKNIFELLPEALNLDTFCKRAMNMLDLHRKGLDEMELASSLHHDFRKMQAMGSRIFEATRRQEPEVAQKELAKMSVLSQRHHGYPRFAMVYHLAAVNNMPFWPGYSSRAHMRHINSMQKILTAHPDMPSTSYERNAAAILRYYVAMGLSNVYYYKGEVPEAYTHALTAWNILSQTPNMRLKKTESHYLNKVSMETAVGKYREAIHTIEELIEFHKVQGQDEKRLQAFSVLATTYTYAYPHIACPDPTFLLHRLNDYIALMQQKHSPAICEALCTKAIFCYMIGRPKEAKELAMLPETQPIFEVPGFGVFRELLSLGEKPTPDEKARVKAIFEQEIMHSDRGDVIESCKRGLRLLGV